MEKHHEEEVKPCRCGTGNYCQRHRRYGKTTTAKEYRRIELDRHEPCGGGCRLFRKVGGE